MDKHGRPAIALALCIAPFLIVGGAEAAVSNGSSGGGCAIGSHNPWVAGGFCRNINAFNRQVCGGSGCVSDGTARVNSAPVLPAIVPPTPVPVALTGDPVVTLPDPDPDNGWKGRWRSSASDVSRGDCTPSGGDTSDRGGLSTASNSGNDGGSGNGGSNGNGGAGGRGGRGGRGR